MPISPPRLDDRSFEDLVEELLARIPAHTPEWVPQPGDPGRTLIELFAWMGETILYRANLIPERQRLAFLKLLGEPMRPARAARGLVSLLIDERNTSDIIHVAAGATVSAAVPFEGVSEVAVLPVTGECYYKRLLNAEELAEEQTSEIIQGLRDFHQIEGSLTAYVTTPLFEPGRPSRASFDLISDSADNSLWLALLAPNPAQVEDVRQSLAGSAQGRAAIINIGIAPAQDIAESFDDNSRPGRIAHEWQISTAEMVNDQPLYSSLTSLADSTEELTRSGIERLILPGDADDFGVLQGNVLLDANAGVGDRPPRLDDPDRLARLVAWLRLRPTRPVTSMALSWVGINALEIEQYQTLQGRVIGQSNGLPDQNFSLPARSIETASFRLQVEQTGRGYIDWQAVEDLALSHRDDAVFVLDSEAGSVTFGNGVNGRIPDAGQRIRVDHLRAGGGSRGNLPVATLNKMTAQDLDGKTIKRKLTVWQGVPTQGGIDAETLAQAEVRIPAYLRHRNRCVTQQDYCALARETPGIELGRVEVLPQFLPQQRRPDVPGVVSVMVLPQKAQVEAPNPRPDRPCIEKVFSYLDGRRPLAAELHVIGCEYIPLALNVGITVRDGAAYDQIVSDVRHTLRQYLWSLSPGGPAGEGWPLGKSVQDRELEVTVARLQGVATVAGINLFQRDDTGWKKVKRADQCAAIEITLQHWQLPELLAIAVTTDGSLNDEPPGAAGATPNDGVKGVAVPVIPEVC